jgi:2Fe-2S ferredoxin
MRLRANGFSIDAAPGDSILSALRAAEKNIFSICGGRGMCGTCRVAIGDVWLDRLPPPAPNETRLLRALKNAAPNHRLACQTILDDTHDGLTFTPDPPPTRVLNKETPT